MSVFTSVSEHQLTQFLRQYSLGELIQFEGLKLGVSNSNYVVQTDQGQFILTLFEQFDDPIVRQYLNINSMLLNHGFPCSKVFVNNDKEDILKLNNKTTILREYLPGEPNFSPDDIHIKQLAKMLAQLHCENIRPAQLPKNRYDWTWFMNTSEKLSLVLNQDDQSLLADEIKYQTKHAPKDLPRGFIHADLFRDNVLFKQNKLTGLIDLYSSCHSFLIYDLAITVNDWCVNSNSEIKQKSLSLFLKTYEQTRKLDDAEQNHWHTMLRLSALRFWISRQYDFHFLSQGEIVQVHNPDVFKQLLLNHRR